MAGKVNPGRQRSAVARTIAWVILVVWAGFWIFFNLASGMAEVDELGIMGLLMHLIMPVALVLIMWVSWRWEIWGGVLLVLAGILSVVFFNVTRSSADAISALTLFVLLVLPALLIGMLLILCGMETMRGAHLAGTK